MTVSKWTSLANTAVWRCRYNRRIYENWRATTHHHRGWILLGSDGLFDPKHANIRESIETASSIINSEIKSENGRVVVNRLIEHAIEVGSKDDITAVLVKFNHAISIDTWSNIAEYENETITLLGEVA